ncbi:MAG: DUF2911 domain-containing protein [Acidobacteriota bacterium]|nr:DUF2911 domain-containing protein [Acidobacteriota bacterium]
MTRRTFFQSGILSGVGIAAVAVPAHAQASPPKIATGTVGGKVITVHYYSPSMRGRKIFGALVPYDEVWCPGANWATTITSLEGGLEIGAMKLPIGTYAIWVLPNEKEWQAIVNSNARAFHMDYRANTDIGRVKMNLKPLDKQVESLAFEVRSEGGNKGTLALLWEKTEASFPFAVG